MAFRWNSDAVGEAVPAIHDTADQTEAYGNNTANTVAVIKGLGKIAQPVLSQYQNHVAPTKNGWASSWAARLRERDAPGLIAANEAIVGTDDDSASTISQASEA